MDPELRLELATDFKKCLCFIWHHLRKPTPTPIQMEVADWLQYGPNRQITMAFRGMGKTWATAAYCVQTWLRDPQKKILVVSASKSHADNTSTFVKKMIDEIPDFAWLRPNKNQRDSKLSFDVGPALNDNAPSMKSVGITGQLTGTRANIIIADDVETPNNTQTQSARTLLREWIKEFDSILKPDDPDSRVIFLGTPQYEQSLYLDLQKNGYEARIWPARFPTDKQRETYGSHLSPMLTRALDRNPGLTGKPTEPLRFGEVDLMERETSMGRSTFALQFMLDTSLSDADRYPLRLSDLIAMPVSPEVAPATVVWATGSGRAEDKYCANHLPSVGLDGDRWYNPMWMDPQFLPYTASVMHIDPAGRGTDETAYAVVKTLNGRLFLTAMNGLPGGYDDATLMKLATVARDQQVNLIRIESNFGDGMFTKIFTPILARIHPCRIEEVRNTKQKERRIIDTLEPVLNSHRLVVNEDIIREDLKAQQQFQLFHQLTRVTRQRGCLGHDDRLDALAGAVGYFAEHLAADMKTKAAEAKAEVWQKELDKFLESANGGQREERGGWIAWGGW